VSQRLAIVLCVALPCIAGAQAKERCNFPNYPQTTQRLQKLPTGQYNTFFGHGVDVRCPTKQLTLKADSLEYYADEGRIFFIGNVHYDEPRLALTSDFLTYFQRDERIIANGNVDARLPSGSTLKGPIAEYQRVIPGVRPIPRLIATGRPTITVIQNDSLGRPQRDSLGRPIPPTTVVANGVTMVGDSLVYAGGSVIVTREDVTARGDSMALDSERQITVLLRNPSIQGKRDRPFTLSGDRIELTGRDKKLERVLSIGKAQAVSQDMTLNSDTIDLRLSNDLLQRAVAWGPTRARAQSNTQRITADSVEVTMPDQRVREMHAVRRAAAEGRPDSTRFKADTVDWMRGDTIVARFDTVTVRAAAAPRDSARVPRDTTTTRIKERVAVGNAKSYCHLPPSDSTAHRPAINYVIGREIIVIFQDQRVSKVTVIEQAAGVYIEPRRETPADSTRGVKAAPATPTNRPATTPPATRPVPTTPPRPPR